MADIPHNPASNIVFVIQKADDHHPAALTLGLSRAAWDHMMEENKFEFDLTKVGVPIRLTMFAAETVARAAARLENEMQKKGVDYTDDRAKG